MNPDPNRVNLHIVNMYDFVDIWYYLVAVGKLILLQYSFLNFNFNYTIIQQILNNAK